MMETHKAVIDQLRYSKVEPGFTFAIFPRRKVNRHHKRPAYIELLTRTLTRKPKIISNRRAKKRPNGQLRARVAELLQCQPVISCAGSVRRFEPSYFDDQSRGAL